MLEVVTASEAEKIIMDCTNAETAAEIVPLQEAFGRFSAEDVCAQEDLPAFSRSSVDGYALKAADTYGCSESIPAMLSYDEEILMGETPDSVLQNGSCFKIPTGGRLPEGADAVCMLEYSDDIGDEFRYFYKPVSAYENVIRQGEDCRIGEIVLKKGTRIGSKNIAILAALGITEVAVAKKIRIGVISTGDELIPFGNKPRKAQIRDINSVMLAAQIAELGAEAVIYPIVKDVRPELLTCVRRALDECDMVCISGGSSAGEKDSTLWVLEELGEVKFHGISIKPGKPTLFAVADGKQIFGLPGHPQAAYMIFRLFAAPAILKKSFCVESRTVMKLKVTQNIPSNHGREEIVPVMICGDEATPVRSKSGVVSILSRSDGYLIIDRNTEGLAKGAVADVYLF